MSGQVSTLDMITGPHLILTADGELEARAARAAAGLPATVTRLEPPLLRRLGAELLVVRPDQVAAAWPGASPGQPSKTEFLDTAMAILCGREGARTPWTQSP